MTHFARFGALALLLALGAPLPAQYTTGRLQGAIADESGMPLPGAAVHLLNLATNAERTVTSTDSGAYFFAAVPPGAYRLRASKDAFATVTTELAISTSETLTRDLRLPIAAQQTSVEVTAETEALNRFEPLRSVSRSTLEIQNLPNAGRNIVNLIVLAPGVTPAFSPRGGNLTTLSIAQAGQVYANGGRSKASSHYLDFTDANDWEFGGIALSTQPAPDMLQEFKILTNNWAAEYGVKSNAQVLMVTRAGSNQPHGAAYDFVQNSALNARDYFDRSGKANPLRQNIFGFAAGGAAKPDRVFLFGGYEGRRSRGSSPVTIANVLTERARASISDANVKQIAGLLPLPTAATANPNIGTVAVSAPSPSNGNQYLLRGDAAIRANHTLAVRYFQNTGTSYNRTAGSLPGFDATFDPQGRNAMIAETWVIHPRATNELRLSYGRASALFSPETNPATPRYAVTGLVGFGTVQSWPQGRIFNVYQWNDVATYVRGRHVWKAGFDLRYVQDNSVNDSSRRGVYTFASVDDFLAGRLAAFSQLFGNTYRGFRTRYDGLFVQDDWKVRPHLTLNLGVRAEFQGGLSEVNRLQSVLDPSLHQAIGNAGTGVLGAFRNEKPSVHPNRNLVAPRLGFAWNPGGGRISVRGGYGIYYDSLIFNGLQAGRYTPPTNYTGALAATGFTDANTLANLIAGTAQMQRDFGSQVGGFGALRNLGSITSSLPDLRNPYAQHFSLGAQTRLSGGMVLDVAYVGTRGVALTTLGPGNSVNPEKRIAPAVSVADETARLAQFQAAAGGVNGVGNSRLDPRFNDVSLLRSNGSSTYHSLQAGFTRPLARGLQVQASYTWSKSIDNASDYSPGQSTNDRSFAQNQFDYRNERAVSAFDIPHRVTLSQVWQARGGWTFSSINQWQMGIPYTVMSGARRGIADVNLDGAGSGTLDNVRASCEAGAGFAFNRPGVGFGYAQPLLGNMGTCGRNTERIANLLNFDWTVSKSVLLAERGPLGSGPWKAEIRADLLNVFNVPYLFPSGDDYRNLASQGFGLANSAGATRRIQMALRLTW